MTKDPHPTDKRSNLLSVIKGKNGKNSEIDFAIFFAVDSWKAWLNNVNRILRQNALSLRKNLVSNNVASPESVYEIFFREKGEDCRNIHLNDSQASITKRTEENMAKQESLHSPNFRHFKVEDILKIDRLTSDIKDERCECGFQGRMDYQATLHDKSWGLLCGSCGHLLMARIGTEGK